MKKRDETAVRRLRNHWPKVRGTWEHEGQIPSLYHNDVRRAANLYLAENPENDGEPLTMEIVAPLVTSLPQEPEPDDYQWHWINGQHVVFLHCDDYGRWSACAMGSSEDSYREICALPTRGHLRRLLGLLFQDK